MKATATLISGLIAACALHAIPVDAQVVRESDVKSIAGVLNGVNPTASWIFRSAGNQILFATLDADIYRMMAEHEHETTAESDAGGGCGGEDDGSPVRFYIEVQDNAGQRICFAERPAPPPGWQRDPRLACVLPTTGGALLSYNLIVGMTRAGEDDEHQTMSAAAGAGHPFILNVSLRGIAPTGTNIQSAVAQSINRL
ncbi:MAG TPA: hypothetical protein VLT59_00480 [Steroidobacteraceae bacterium]|nr:hypothetical protein [Steroidobacteraceae bacterium]